MFSHLWYKKRRCIKTHIEAHTRTHQPKCTHITSRSLIKCPGCELCFVTSKHFHNSWAGDSYIEDVDVWPVGYTNTRTHTLIHWITLDIRLIIPANITVASNLHPLLLSICSLWNSLTCVCMFMCVCMLFLLLYSVTDSFFPCFCIFIIPLSTTKYTLSHTYPCTHINTLLAHTLAHIKTQCCHFHSEAYMPPTSYHPKKGAGTEIHPCPHLLSLTCFYSS